MTDELADRPEDWPVVESRDLHRGDWVVALRSDRIRHPDQPDGETFKRIILEHPGAVVVLAIDDQDRARLPVAVPARRATAVHRAARRT